jgi:excisionase family DNA binding protein
MTERGEYAYKNRAEAFAHLNRLWDENVYEPDVLNLMRDELMARWPEKPLAPVAMPDDPNTLLTARQAAQHLNVTPEQLLAHVHDGTLRGINVSRGSKRGRWRFTRADLDQFKASRTQEQPCPSTPQRNRRASTGTISNCKVIGFTARRALLLAAKPKNSKR